MNTKTKLICWDLENTKVTGKVKVSGKVRASIKLNGTIACSLNIDGCRVGVRELSHLKEEKLHHFLQET